MSWQTLIVRYSTFSVIAMAINLAVQRVIFNFIGDWIALPIALLMGTTASLIVKYSLDKRWIFHDPDSTIRSHARKFSLYTLMGSFTTLIFWGTETIFWLIWQNDLMREAGALIGLVIGYVVKYQLDLRYVFNDIALNIDDNS